MRLMTRVARSCLNSDRRGTIFVEVGCSIYLSGAGLNHVDWKLVYTNRARLKIIQPHGGLVIQAGYVFDGSTEVVQDR